MKLNNKGQSLVLFICLLPVLILMFGVVVDVSDMAYEKSKIDDINYIAISYLKDNINNNDVVNKTVNLIKQNDIDIINIKIDINNKEIYINKKIDSIFGKIIGLNNYEIVSRYKISEDKIKRIK